MWALEQTTTMADLAQTDEESLDQFRRRIMERFQCSEEEADNRMWATIQALLEDDLPPPPPPPPPTGGKGTINWGIHADYTVVF